MTECTSMNLRNIRHTTNIQRLMNKTMSSEWGAATQQADHERQRRKNRKQKYLIQRRLRRTEFVDLLWPLNDWNNQPQHQQLDLLKAYSNTLHIQIHAYVRCAPKVGPWTLEYALAHAAHRMRPARSAISTHIHSIVGPIASHMNVVAACTSMKTILWKATERSPARARALT